MSVLIEAKNILKNGFIGPFKLKFIQFIESQNLFEQELYNLVVEENIFKHHDYEFNRALLNYLERTKQPEIIYQLTKHLPVPENYYFENEKLLDACWAMGRINDFEHYLKQIHEDILYKKLFPKYKMLSTKYFDQLSLENYFVIGRIVYALELGNYTELDGILDVQLQKFLSENLSLTLTEAIYNILEQYNVDSGKIYKNLLLFKAGLSIKKDYLLDEKEIVELILLADSKIEYILAALVIKDEKLQDILLKVIRTEFKVKMSDLPELATGLKSKFKKRINISKIEIAQDEDLSDIGYEFSETLEKSITRDNPIEKVDYTYELSEDEKGFLRYFKMEMDENLINPDLIVGLIKMDLFKLAEMFALKLSQSSNRYYLLCKIYIGMGHPSEAIYYANKCLQEYGLCDEEAIPFEDIKAVAFSQAGDDFSAGKCMQKIISIDPSFRRIKDKMIK